MRNRSLPAGAPQVSAAAPCDGAESGPRGECPGRLQGRPAESAGLLATGPWAMLLVLLVTAAAYVDSLGYGFVWDDKPMVLQSRSLRHPGNLWTLVRSDFTELTAGEMPGHYYRPVLALGLAPNGAVIREAIGNIRRLEREAQAAGADQSAGASGSAQEDWEDQPR